MSCVLPACGLLLLIPIASTSYSIHAASVLFFVVVSSGCFVFPSVFYSARLPRSSLFTLSPLSSSILTPFSVLLGYLVFLLLLLSSAPPLLSIAVAASDFAGASLAANSSDVTH